MAGRKKIFTKYDEVYANEEQNIMSLRMTRSKLLMSGEDKASVNAWYQEMVTKLSQVADKEVIYHPTPVVVHAVSNPITGIPYDRSFLGTNEITLTDYGIK